LRSTSSLTESGNPCLSLPFSFLRFFTLLDI
jgi:hypothetical protein